MIGWLIIAFIGGMICAIFFISIFGLGGRSELEMELAQAKEDNARLTNTIDSMVNDKTNESVGR